MSEKFMVHFVCDNAIDPSVTDEKFAVYTEVASYFNNNSVKAIFADFKKLSIPDVGNDKKFWLTYEYGHNLFMRSKYVFLDSLQGMLLGRDGETLPFGKDSGLSDQEYTAEMYARISPPADELKSLFDYILSLNTHFYILLSLMPFQEEMDDFDSFPCYHRGNLMEGRKVVEMDSETAQALLIKDVEEWFDKSLNYTWVTYEEIMLDENFVYLNNLQDPLFQTIFKIS